MGGALAPVTQSTDDVSQSELARWEKGEKTKMVRGEELTSVNSADGSAELFLCIQMEKKTVRDMDMRLLFFEEVPLYHVN